MHSEDKQMDKFLVALKERTKELNCLYRIEGILSDFDKSLESAFQEVIEVIPPAWQYVDLCKASIHFKDQYYRSRDFQITPWILSAEIKAEDETVGKLEVVYIQEMPQQDKGPFLKEEINLINAIAGRLGNFIHQKQLRQLVLDMQRAEIGSNKHDTNGWIFAIDLLKRTDQTLFATIARKMLNHLSWSGITEANDIFKKITPDGRFSQDSGTYETNRPQQKSVMTDTIKISDEIFEIASKKLASDDILTRIHKWMLEDKACTFLKSILNPHTSITDISDSIRRFVHLDPAWVEISESTRKGIKVSLLRRLVSPQIKYISIANNYVKLTNFHELTQRLISPTGGYGVIGGKSAGLWLATHILKKNALEHEELQGIKVPKTWYITTDGLHSFMNYNNMEEVFEQKYKDIGQIRQEYPHIIQLFKNSLPMPEIIQGLSMALDDFGERPIIVRSSSLLEDSFEAAFSGKYKSLFLANQGSKEKRLEALMDAIAEVYSSTFSPDPIEYRIERGLIDISEEMGILIQEVVGSKVGNYFLPAYAGVAFSNNEFRWSHRIKRNDGLIRMVPGLGTRAVDRVKDDYPMLIAPGQPGLRVNVSPDEIIHYSPCKMDVINLETNSFETVNLQEFAANHSDDFPALRQIMSIMSDGHLRQISMTDYVLKKDELVATFDNLISNTPFIQRIRTVLKVLQDALKTPVDIEFASDGNDFYLLQCRPQSRGTECESSPIPKDIPEKDIIFSANRYVSNGTIADITHLVYVDPFQYNKLKNREDMLDVGRVVNALNSFLPRKQFILMGPGRWGSRGDIKLGVNVTYSNINNTAVLIEIARKKGNYIPELSFGTHFFQDLVEASIRYLPLYPDDEKVIFNEIFFTNSPNILSVILPQYQHLSNVVKVIDVPKTTGGKIVRILMNGDLDEAIAFFAEPSAAVGVSNEKRTQSITPQTGNHWHWRMKMAERIAECINADVYGIEAMYVIGSTKNATAGPSSDIDLLVHFRGTEDQRISLLKWLEGWSLCLDEMNYLRTGYRTTGLLDIHILTDEDIAQKNSYAAKIDAVTDAARKLTLKKS